jgi:hypothetical protein
VKLLATFWAVEGFFALERVERVLGDLLVDRVVRVAISG